MRRSDEPRKPLALASFRVDRLPIGTELVVRVLKTSTGAYRCRVDIAKFAPGVDMLAGAVSTPIDDRSMKFADLALDLQRFGGENLANAAITALDAGAGKQM